MPLSESAAFSDMNPFFSDSPFTISGGDPPFKSDLRVTGGQRLASRSSDDPPDPGGRQVPALQHHGGTSTLRMAMGERSIVCSP